MRKYSELIESISLKNLSRYSTFKDCDRIDKVAQICEMNPQGRFPTALSIIGEGIYSVPVFEYDNVLFNFSGTKRQRLVLYSFLKKGEPVWIYSNGVNTLNSPTFQELVENGIQAYVPCHIQCGMYRGFGSSILGSLKNPVDKDDNPIENFSYFRVKFSVKPETAQFDKRQPDGSMKKTPVQYGAKTFLGLSFHSEDGELDTSLLMEFFEKEDDISPEESA